MKRIALTLALVVAALIVALRVPRGSQAQPLAPPVADFQLNDTQGKPFRFYSLAGQKAAVLYFVGADCPIAKLSLPKLAQLAAQYERRGVAFVGINANAHETATQTAAAARAAGVTFPILMDPHQEVADALKVTRTCEAVVTDGQAVLRYRGPIDDQYGLGSRKPAASKHFLTDAIEAVLANRTVTITPTATPGCLLDRLPASERDAPPSAAPDAPLPAVGKVTYTEQVAPILQNKCESCHRPGQVAPFPLQSYEQARRWVAMIGETVQTKRMPPWHADPRHGDFVNDRSLSPKERAILLAWVKQGAPQGDPKKLPSPRVFADSWAIGKPDVVLTMPQSYTVKATGTLPYQWFRIPTGFTEDRWIQASEVRPGERSVVHHVLVFIDDHKGSRANGLDGFVAGYVPGEVPMTFPAGVAKRVPAGADLLLQVHYTPVGTEKTDRSSVGFIFAKEKPSAIAETVGILQPILRIPPQAENHKVERRFVVPVNTTAYAYWPHMHLRGKAFRLSATYPDGKEEILLSVPRYDFNWQARYQLKTPKALPKGTQLLVEAWFDNSSKNPHNPAPDKWVTWGEQTDDEMMIGYLDYVAEGNQTQRLRLQNLLGGFRRSKP